MNLRTDNLCFGYNRVEWERFVCMWKVKSCVLWNMLVGTKRGVSASLHWQQYGAWDWDVIPNEEHGGPQVLQRSCPIISYPDKDSYLKRQRWSVEACDVITSTACLPYPYPTQRCQSIDDHRRNQNQRQQ